MTKSVTYQVGDSGTVEPSGSWLTDIPSVPQGKYLWTRTSLQFNTGNPITWYSVAYAGINGTGAVSTVCGKSPDETGNVAVTADDVGALPSAGGGMTGPIAMGGNKVTELGTPIDSGDAATKGYVDSKRITKAATIPTNWSGSSAPYTQSISVTGILSTDAPHITPVYSSTLETALMEKDAWAMISKAETSNGTVTFTCFEDKPATEIPIQIEVMR